MSESWYPSRLHEGSCLSPPIDPAIQFAVVGRTSLQYDMSFPRQQKISSTAIFPLLRNTSKASICNEKKIIASLGRMSVSGTQPTPLSVEGKLKKTLPSTRPLTRWHVRSVERKRELGVGDGLYKWCVSHSTRDKCFN